MSRSEKQPIHVRYIRSKATLPQARESLTTYSQPGRNVCDLFFKSWPCTHSRYNCILSNLHAHVSAHVFVEFVSTVCVFLSRTSVLTYFCLL